MIYVQRGNFQPVQAVRPCACSWPLPEDIPYEIVSLHQKIGASLDSSVRPHRAPQTSPASCSAAAPPVSLGTRPGRHQQPVIAPSPAIIRTVTAASSVRSSASPECHSSVPRAATALRRCRAAAGAFIDAPGRHRR